jgi:hypothetical protein
MRRKVWHMRPYGFVLQKFLWKGLPHTCTHAHAWHAHAWHAHACATCRDREVDVRGPHMVAIRYSTWHCRCNDGQSHGSSFEHLGSSHCVLFRFVYLHRCFICLYDMSSIIRVYAEGCGLTKWTCRLPKSQGVLSKRTLSHMHAG